MFETSRRQHPLHSFRFWFVVLAAASVTLAWKFDLLPFRIGPAATGELSDEVFTDVNTLDESDPAAAEHNLSLPFADGDETLDVPALASSASHPQQTAQLEPVPPLPTQTEPTRSAGVSDPQQATSFDLFSDDDWSTTASTAAADQQPGQSMATGPLPGTPVQQTSATSALFESAASADVTETVEPFATADVSSVSPLASMGIDFTEIDQRMASGLTNDEIEAHRLLSTHYWQTPAARPALRERIDMLSQQIYFLASRHYMDAYEVQPGDRLQSIARQYDISWQYLAKLNRIDPKKIRPGQRLKVIKGPFSAVVDLSDYELTIHAHGYYVTRYPVGIGKDGSSPIGKFAVQEKLIDPTYYGPDGVVAHDDPTNPLGERWIDLGNSYGIHGTIDPTSIGKSESRGCIRLHNDDVAAVYDLLTIGSEVTIRP